MMIQLHEKELVIIKYIQELRCSVLDGWFSFLGLFDTQYFFLLLIPVIWVGYYWKSGLRIFLILMISWTLNFLFKELFMQPRPFQLDSTIGLTYVRNYGLPSGAAQICMLLGLIFITTWRRPWAWIIGINYIFWVSLSRLYLGVHFLSDIIVGWFIGIILFFIYQWFFPFFEKGFKKYHSLGLFFIVPVILLLLPKISEKFRIIFGYVSMVLGLFFCYRYQLFLSKARSIKIFLIRSVVGIIGTYLIYIPFYYLYEIFPSPQFSIIRFVGVFLIGIWLTAGSSFIFKRWKKYL